MTEIRKETPPFERFKQIIENPQAGDKFVIRFAGIPQTNEVLEVDTAKDHIVWRKSAPEDGRPEYLRREGTLTEFRESFSAIHKNHDIIF
jgi:hypothetical protein